jgi:hypothetical protein
MPVSGTCSGPCKGSVGFGDAERLAIQVDHSSDLRRPQSDRSAIFQLCADSGATLQTAKMFGIAFSPSSEMMMHSSS